MIVDDIGDQSTRRFELELFPPTRRDAAQAVLYRVGEALDLRGQDTWSPACSEALTERLLPRQRCRRKRWISAVRRENPVDLARPPHMRPALVTAAVLARFLPGGLLVEKLHDLGKDPVHQAVVITWLAKRAGLPGVRGMEDTAPDIATNPMGTFTVGELKPHRGRRGSTARTDWPVQAHVHRLKAAALSAVEARGARARYDELYDLFDKTVSSAITARGPEFEISFAGHTSSSQLFPDLTVDAARDLTQRMRAEHVHPVRAWETLQLAGFINEHGNRRWNRELVEHMGGWRD